MNFSNKKYKILKKISLKVYGAERVAIISDGQNSGRHSLLQLILLNQDHDNDELNMELKRSVIELLGLDTKLINKKVLRREMFFMSQHPCLFYGSVKENIDPYNQFDESEIIRTLHFLKVLIFLIFLGIYSFAKFYWTSWSQ